ncbi:MAG: hypothetical protein F6K00_25010 [Leptolyngbya sp. SIOISBB]|nr:hypothetical protein [Leptolyngbya sp. SIOISBB]
MSDPTELLRWWHQHQAQMLLQETDFLRNGVLQEIIAIRRRLEVSCPLRPTAEHPACEPHLADLSRLYSLLENFCDRLQSPFSPDSLPLALQHTLQPWQERLHLQTRFPATWQPEPLEQTQLLVLLMKALLPILAETAPALQATTLSLSEANHLKTLVLTGQYAPVLEPALTTRIEQTVQPFLDTFCLFTEAISEVMFQTEGFFLKLRWHSPSATPESDYPHADPSP